MRTSPASTDSSAGQIRLRYWASARAAAGAMEDIVDVTGPVSLEVLREQALTVHAGSARFAQVIETCSVLIGDRPVGSTNPADVEVLPGQTVEFLPPFAGG